MRLINDLNATPTIPAKDATINFGFAPKVVDPNAAARLDEDCVNSILAEHQNAINVWSDAGTVVPTDDTQLLQCFNNVASGITASTAENFVRKPGDTMTGALIIETGSNSSLATSGSIQAGGLMYVTSSNPGNGTGGVLQLQGGTYPAQTENGISYPAGVGTGTRIDTLADPAGGNTLRLYNPNYTAGDAIITFNTDNGIVTAPDFKITSEPYSVGTLLASIGGGGNLFVRGTASNLRVLYFYTSDPGTTDGFSTGFIAQQGSSAGAAQNTIVICANASGANPVQIAPNGNVEISTIINAPTGVLAPGYSNQAAYAGGAGTFTVPANIYRVRVTIVGAGGGGAGCAPNSSFQYVSGAGGGAGGFAVTDIAVSPAQQLTFNVGLGGAGGSYPGGIAQAGTAGGTSIVYGIGYATGGSGGGWDGTGQSAAGGGPGFGTIGVYGDGGCGSDGQQGPYVLSGNGGASYFGGGGRAGAGGGVPGYAPGSGGGGAYNTASAGGSGANGIIVFEW